MNVQRICSYFGLFLFCCLLRVNGSTGPEKHTNEDLIDYKVIFDDLEDVGKTPSKLPFSLGENEIKKHFNTEIDEELVRKAEMVAQQDLLGGLNMILKNHETLEDVIRKEGIGDLS